MRQADPLYLFGITVADSPELQEAFQRCRSLDAIVALMRVEGFELSVQQLRRFASRHDDPWWPWAGQTPAWKEAFFHAARRRQAFNPLSSVIDLLGEKLARRALAPRRWLA